MACVDLSGTFWRPLLEFYQLHDVGDIILIAPKASKDFERQLRGLQALREAGVLDED